ncbi:tyrosine-protein phosphatase [Brevibacterium daeguense]|uniref:Tyrosine-protein phosphatase n=1 Tax=Brevibacterium daeguense TaxID=909936 RepID=A0ABP8EHT4_9MICO|nr:tyrosine-protein phosphatase [Brevibacterium daeguense]
MTIADVPLSTPVNLRDLGGIPVDGGTIRSGFVIRSDDLATVTEAVADGLVADGVRTVIDLRSAVETELTGRGPFGNRAVAYHHIPFTESLETSIDSGALSDAEDFGEALQAQLMAMYTRMYETSAEQIVSALAVIAHSPGAVAFHCLAGQDRTGVLAAALLLVLGAEPAVIVADYARTGENSAAILERVQPVIRPLLARFGADLNQAAQSAARYRFSEAPMRALLDDLDRDYEDPLLPLRRAGLDHALIARLRERALGGPEMTMGTAG